MFHQKREVTPLESRKTQILEQGNDSMEMLEFVRYRHHVIETNSGKDISIYSRRVDSNSFDFFVILT